MSDTASALAAVAFVWWILAGCSAAASAQDAPPHPRPIEATAHVEGNAPATQEDEGANALPEISIEILGPISTLKGHEWPRGYDLVGKQRNQPLGQILVNRPHELVIHLPSGRTIRHISKATFFNHERGTVTRASLMPHPGLLHYQDVIKLLELILEQWDAEPNERAKKSLQRWKAEGDVKPSAIAQHYGGAVLRGEDKAGIFFQIHPSTDGWFLTLDVAATLEEERRLWGLPDAPASQPASKPVEDKPKQSTGGSVRPS